MQRITEVIDKILRPNKLGRVKVEWFVHDIVYDFLEVMKAQTISGEGEYEKGYIDGFAEAYRILRERISSFDLEHLPIVAKMPTSDEWVSKGPASIELD